MKKLTAYEAQKRGLHEWKEHEQEKTILHKHIDELESNIKNLSERKKLRFWLKIKSTSFDISEDYLNTFLTAVQPIKDVVQAEWGRYKEENSDETHLV